MRTLIFLTACIAATMGLTPPHITGTTPPPVYCPDELCIGKYDGNYDYHDYITHVYNSHYFLQCSGGNAYCQACWPLELEFSQGCNQCLYSKYDQCVTTKIWYPATTFHCPDICHYRDPHFSGNIVDPGNKKQYVACWNGVTVGCIACPSGLEFNEQWNACLYEGIYKTAPNPHVGNPYDFSKD